MTTIRLFVPGRPAAQGSKKHVGNGRMIESSKNLAPWRTQVAWFARKAMIDANATMITTATVLRLTFVMPRPLATPKRATPPATKKPDLDKLVRACFDAITNVVISDDSIVTDLWASKRLAEIGEEPGVRIVATTVERQS